MRLLTGLLIAAFLLTGQASADIVINEFQPNPDGTDPTMQTIELMATMGETDFTGFWGSIEGDNAFAMNDSGSMNVTFDSNGLATFDVGDLENPTFTFFISTLDHSGATGIGGITSAIDALGVPDNNADTLYGAMLGGVDLVNHDDPGFDNEPILAFRDSTTLDWVQVYEDDPGTSSYFAFDASGTQLNNSSFNIDPTATTFNTVNPTQGVPEPASIVLLGAAGLALAIRRRR